MLVAREPPPVRLDREPCELVLDLEGERAPDIAARERARAPRRPPGRTGPASPLPWRRFLAPPPRRARLRSSSPPRAATRSRPAYRASIGAQRDLGVQCDADGDRYELDVRMRDRLAVVGERARAPARRGCARRLLARGADADEPQPRRGLDRRDVRAARRSRGPTDRRRRRARPSSPRADSLEDSGRDALHVGLAEVRVHREREHPRGRRLGDGERAGAEPEARERRLQVERRVVVQA